jgi:hypothetical protein
MTQHFGSVKLRCSFRSMPPTFVLVLQSSRFRPACWPIPLMAFPSSSTRSYASNANKLPVANAVRNSVSVYSCSATGGPPCGTAASVCSRGAMRRLRTAARASSPQGSRPEAAFHTILALFEPGALELHIAGVGEEGNAGGSDLGRMGDDDEGKRGFRACAAFGFCRHFDFRQCGLRRSRRQGAAPISDRQRLSGRRARHCKARESEKSPLQSVGTTGAMLPSALKVILSMQTSRWFPSPPGIAQRWYTM